MIVTSLPIVVEGRASIRLPAPALPPRGYISPPNYATLVERNPMRLRGTEKLLLLVSAAFACNLASAQEVRLVQQNGSQFVESTQTVRQPVASTTVERQEQTVYREEYITQVQESQQTYLAPVTEYHWEPRVHGRLNPFRPNTVAYHLVPRTRWETRSHTVRTPVTTRQLRPETRVVEIPRRQLGFAQQQQTTRTALAPRGSSFTSNTATTNSANPPASTSVAARHHALPSSAPAHAANAPAATNTTGGTVVAGDAVVIPRMATRPGVIGGVHQMDGDHPRFGTATQRY